VQPSPLILIVDDEAEIAKCSGIFLRKAGYQTKVAFSGFEALDGWSPDVELLITDWAMHDLFGDQVASRLLEQKPSLKVLYMSGNPMDSVESGVVLEEGVNFIHKPFSGRALVALVQRILSPAQTKQTSPH
jgi:two-component system cell cycle sensor histidine kinase/response regulator CckA